MDSSQKDKQAFPDKGKILPAKEGVDKAIIDFLKQSLEKNALMPFSFRSKFWIQNPMPGFC